MPLRRVLVRISSPLDGNHTPGPEGAQQKILPLDSSLRHFDSFYESSRSGLSGLADRPGGAARNNRD
ncbi:hypothetical protein MTBUT4_500022 [Magnetospirillum sp. UT-4]|nr:hypothetical protein MTBUT4_500022 [Magnetospirillum sp. UT-4]